MQTTRLFPATAIRRYSRVRECDGSRRPGRKPSEKTELVRPYFEMGFSLAAESPSASTDAH